MQEDPDECWTKIIINSILSITKSRCRQPERLTNEIKGVACPQLATCGTVDSWKRSIRSTSSSECKQFEKGEEKDVSYCRTVNDEFCVD